MTVKKSYYTQAQAALAASFAVGCADDIPEPGLSAARVDKLRESERVPEGLYYDPLPVARFIANAKEFSTTRKLWKFAGGIHWYVKCDGVKIEFETNLLPVELGFNAPIE